MKRLVRLLMINWYRLEQASIDIVGHTAVIGPNASGKSSLLDAIQAVLVGGDKRWWNPNASAGEKSTRSLRDYCLGVVRDPSNPDLSQEFRPRDQAITYLALVFRDEESQESISVGLALHARLDEAQEVIDGRFLAPGLDLVLSDLVDRTPEGPIPKPWRRLREELRMRVGEPFEVFPQVGEYQRHLCALLSDGRRHLDPPRFLRAFRNAITFAPIRNVSDFVRSHILEERPIQVRSLQQALQHYRDIQTRTREAKSREEALAAIDHRYQRAEQAERLGLAWRWVEQEAAFNALEAELEPLRGTLDRLTTEIASTRRPHRRPGGAMAARRQRPDRGQSTPGRHQRGAAAGAHPRRDTHGADQPGCGQSGHRGRADRPRRRASTARQRRPARRRGPGPGAASPPAPAAPR